MANSLCHPYPLTLFCLIIILLRCSVSSFSYSQHNHSCSDDHTSALLQFKKTLSIHSYASEDCDSVGQISEPKTEYWKRGTDCCTWAGVTCDWGTGHVIELDLSCSQLQGIIHSNSTLFHLSHLKRLNLAFNHFSGSQISHEFGGFAPDLTHLNLSWSSFRGKVSSKISHLSKLLSLDLSDNGIEIESQNFKLLIQNLTQLTQLSLSFVNISSVLPMNLSSSLTFLHLSFTGLHGKLPHNIFNILPNLKELDLSDNEGLTGPFPEVNVSARSNPLRWLDISGTSLLDRKLPDSIVNLRSLDYLNLRFCGLSGPIPESLRNLTSLSSIFLGENKFSGPFPIFLLTSQLVSLDLSSNSLTGPIPSDIVGLHNLIQLDISNNSFNGTLPSWLFALPSLEYLNLGLNRFTGQIHEVKSTSLRIILLSNNDLHGPIPNSISNLVNLTQLDLSYNQIHGQLPPNFLLSNQLYSLQLQSNFIQGPLPSSICSFSFLDILDLSNNTFKGTIPQCLGNFSLSLSVLNLRMNRFYGPIPTTFGAEGNYLESLNLHGNKLEGTLPRTLANCTNLQVLDLGNNLINDTFPHWLSTLPKLQILVLRYNRFHGPIRNTSETNKFLFSNLRIIDLSHNQFTGFLPSNYFRNFKAMTNVKENEIANIYMMHRRGHNYYDEITLVMKGVDTHIVRILTVFTTIDFSSNGFEGEIPNSIGNLNSLRVLNLSHNRLTYPIPSALASLSNLESLDLSSNQFVGQIPQQLTALTFLEVLNLSQNNLVGPIPQGKQFYTFQNDSYIGNSGLCDFPLSKKCRDGETPHPPIVQQEKDSDFANGFTWKVVLMGYGCGTVFGLVMGYLMFLTGRPRWFTKVFENRQHKNVRRGP